MANQPRQKCDNYCGNKVDASELPRLYLEYTDIVGENQSFVFCSVRCLREKTSSLEQLGSTPS